MMANCLPKLLAMLTAIFVWRADSCLSQPVDDAYGGKDKTLLPTKGWPCGMLEGIPVPERGVPVFVAAMKLDQVYDVGRTPYGQRKVYVVQSGTVTGEKINGSVMSGGLDFELSFSNGTIEVEQVLVLKTGDGKYIYLRTAGTAADRSDVRMVPAFEVPSASSLDWLNVGNYAGRREVNLAAGTMKLSVFDVSNIATAADRTNSVRVVKPADMPDQPWDYRRAAAGEKRGTRLITEHVTLGASQSVGATKNGGRNVIPITGGNLSGKITGRILAGGADYQCLANPMTFDARYLWQIEDGDVIIVRNAGPVASLAPIFEVRVDSKHAWLNKGTYLSSSPTVGAGSVRLSFYESSP
jgi:hypothetical protein